MKFTKFLKLRLFLENQKKKLCSLRSGHHMISSIQNFLQKHHKWLFGILLFVIVVSFVFTIGSSPGIGHTKRKSVYFFGQDLLNQNEMHEFSENAVYSNILEFKNADLEYSNLNFLVGKRIICLGLAKTFRIPNPSSEDLQKYLKSLPVFFDENGKFSPDVYNSVIEMFSRNGADKNRFKQVICENYKINMIQNLISGPGVSFEDQIQMAFHRLNTEYDFVVATINGDNVSRDYEVTDDEISQFYNDHPNRYTRPQMHAVSMIRFESKDFEQSVPMPSESRLMEFFEKNRNNFSQIVTFEDSKSTIIDAYIKSESTKLAYASAENFVDTLYQNDVKLNTDAFLETLNKFGVKKENIAAYSKKKLPSVNGVNTGYLLSVCDLDGDRYYSDPHPATFGSVVLFLEKVKPAQTLTLDQSKSAVKDDIIREKGLQEFTNRVESLRKEILIAMELNDSVAEVLRGHNIPFESYSGISVRNAEEKKLDPLFQQALNSLSENDHIKIMAMSDNQVLMLILLDKHLATGALFRSTHDYIENQINKFNKSSILIDFVNGQMQNLPKL